MTIIQPNKYEDVKKLAVILGVVLVVAFLGMMAVFIQTVSLRHDVEAARKMLEEIAVENAELKNEYYALVDAEHLLTLAEERGFVQDRNPQWAFASPF